MGRKPNKEKTALIHTAIPEGLKKLVDVFIKGQEGRAVQRGDYQNFFVRVLTEFFEGGKK